MIKILCGNCRRSFDAQCRDAQYCSVRCRVHRHRHPARRLKAERVTVPCNGSRSEPAKLRVIPLTLSQANQAVAKLHRHHGKVVGHRFSIGINLGDDLVGAAIIGRPVARHYDHHEVAEVTRLVTDGTPHVASKLYAAAARACTAMGYKTLQTYTLDSEPGTSLRAAGWTRADTVTDTNWGRRSLRGNGSAHAAHKVRWIRPLG